MIKKLSIVAFMAVSLAGPALAQENPFAQNQSAQERSVRALHHYRGVYNQAEDSEFNAQTRTPTSEPYFDHDSYDPSRVGGHNPSFNPPS